MRTTADSDWLGDDNTAAETAITEAPAGPRFWRCDGDGFEPEAHPTLMGATGDKPATPDAIVTGGGELLAESDQETCQWVYTAAGMRWLEQEQALVMARDSDVVLSVLLGVDFELDMVGS